MQTFLINLDRTPDRLAKFERTNPHLKNVTRFPAIDGRAISREKLVGQNIFDADVNYSPGAIGCALSHFRLWNMVMTDRQPATIMEDDAILHHDFETLAPAVTAGLPADWDILVWGWNLDSIMLYDLFPGIGVSLMQSNAESIRKSWPDFQGNPIHPAAHRLTACFGTVCYSISPAGAEKLTSRLVPVRNFVLPLPQMKRSINNTGIDIMLISQYSRINAFVSMPPLALTLNDIAVSVVQDIAYMAPV
ncbi:MAG: glycosyltransferase family 25 protein [Bdellovibrionales bacterium]